ncbi:MAG: bifunctional fucokinase/L-fucose-1-P-guanylyltransferase [Prevotella sp.]|nr:bifunctional fucokinase/L-fucose-1-P-guanylyltransferase [Prevotella sp.]
MKKLLSLPPNLVRKTSEGKTVFHTITGLPDNEYFCTCDPEGHRIGSGGGTAWLLMQAFKEEEAPLSSPEGDTIDAAVGATEAPSEAFSHWLKQEKRILLHAGGQSRRLPAYAPSGKILTPVPVFRWERGQRLSQDLLSLQLPLYEQMMGMAPEGLNTMVVSGDVLIRATQTLPPIPQTDVVCYGLWLDADIAKDHGVFVADRRTPTVLKRMLQKPSVAELQALQNGHFYLTDIGIWLLSDRAVKLLMSRSVEPAAQPTSHFSPLNSQFKYYDLYADFGCTLGTDPLIDDPELRQLTVAIIPLPGGEFYHFGTSSEMISSTVAMQNVVSDQRQIMHHDRKPHPSIFVQNAVTNIAFTAENTNVWVENSYIGPRWVFSHDNIVTGVPENDWQVTLGPGQCLDIVPIGDDRYAVRPYHIDDRFAGDEQQRPQFPVLSYNEIESWLREKLGANNNSQSSILNPQFLSAEELSAQANLVRLFGQRDMFRARVLPALARNWQHSVFYQLDLNDAAALFAAHQIPLPQPLSADAPLLTRIHDAMFRGDSDLAFGLLREGLTQRALAERQLPRLNVCHDQIVWARSPVRIDISGGWTDTPPFCLFEGGNVVNLAIELNGQPPLQAYIKPSREPKIILRSIDLGATEVVETFDDLQQFNRVGSPFSIPKAALALAGFVPSFAAEQYTSLHQQLEDFGSGIELTLLSAVPAGSGLGTSSILAATVLGAVNDFCALAWDKNEIGRRTLVLEQLLTTGGGWQDQFGGVLNGVKLLQTQAGFVQDPVVRWLPTDIYTQPEYSQCHLLYYTGITRTAKQILAEIVRRMFLNSHDQLLLLRQMKDYAIEMYEAIQRQDFRQMGRLIRQNWLHNQQLDSGTNPEAVRRLTALVDDLCYGYKLPGAGGGGFLYMVAKDPEAAARIKQRLAADRQSANARFVDMSLSATGLQVSRS